MTDDAAARRRARAALRSGAERAGARSHFRAMGIDPDRLDGPIVGIASTWTQTMPCNLNHRRLAERAAAAEDLVARAHERCPYSNATRGNIDHEFEVKGGG